MDTLIHIDNNIINSLPNELIELVLENVPFKLLIKCRDIPIIDEYINKKYFSLENIFKHMQYLVKNHFYICHEYNFKHATIIIDKFMSIIDNNGGLIKKKTHDGQPIEMYLLRIKNKKTTTFELINKFDDDNMDTTGSYFGHSRSLHYVYDRINLINKLEYSFRFSGYSSPYESIEIIKINYPNGYDKTINGIDYVSPHEEIIMIKFL